MGRKLFVCLIIVLLFICVTNANDRVLKDAFVLVDVSGSMRSSQINNEAKQMILDMLKGSCDKLQWRGRDWVVNIDCDVFTSGSPIIRAGSLLCVMPFGNKDRCYSRKLMQIQNSELELDSFFNNSYPIVYGDALTYLQLAQAYAGSVAKANNLDKSYVIIYSDGMQEQTSSHYPYNKQENALIDSLGYVGSNSYRKIGVFSKSYQQYTFKVEIYELTTYNTPFNKEDIIISPPLGGDRGEIKITSPQAKTPKNPKALKVNDKAKVMWIGSSDAVVYIMRKNNDGKYIRLKRQEPNAKAISHAGNETSIEFYESGEYQVKISDSITSDSVYFSISSRFPFGLIFALIALIAIVGAAAKYFTKKSPIPDPFWGEDTSSRGRTNKTNHSTTSENW